MELVKKWEKCVPCDGVGTIPQLTGKKVGEGQPPEVRDVKCGTCKGTGKRRCDKFSKHKILTINDGILCHDEIPMICPVQSKGGGQAVCSVYCTAFHIRQNDTGLADYATCTIMGKEIIGLIEFSEDGNESDS